MKNAIDDFLADLLCAWVERVCARPRLVVAITALVSLVLGAYAAVHLGVNSDNVRLISEDLPSRQNHEAFAAIFPNLENALLVVIDGETAELTREATTRLSAALEAQPERYRNVYRPGGGEFFERHGLLYRSPDDLDDFADEMARIQPILAELERDNSIANLASLVRTGLEHHDAGTSTTDWGSVLDQVSRATVSLYREYPLAVSWEAVLLKGSSVDVVRRRVIVVDPILDFSSLLAAGRAIENIRQTASELELTSQRGLRVRVTGNPALNYEEMFHIAWDIAYAGIFCFGLVVVILYIALRSIQLVIAAVAALLVGLIWTAGFASVAIGHLNLVSMSFAVLFIGLGVDFAIHLCMAYADAVRSGRGHLEALRLSVEQVGSSLVVCAFTTALGFYVFVPTDYKGVAELGLIAGSGMFIIVFQSLTLIPALLSSWLKIRPSSISAPVRFRHGWWSFFEAHPRGVRWTASLVALCAVALVPRANFDTNVVAMRDPSTESVQAFNDLLAEGGMQSPWFLNSVAPNLADAQTIAAQMQALDSVDQTVTLRDYVPAEQEDKLDILADIAFLLESPGAATEKRPAPSIEEQTEALRELRDFLARQSAGHEQSGFGESMKLLRDRITYFLDDVESKGNHEEALEKLEAVLLSGLPDQIGRLRASVNTRAVGLADLPEQLVQRMQTPDGRARVQIFPSQDLADEAAFDHFVTQVTEIDPKASGVAVNLVAFGRAIKQSFKQALITALGSIFVLLLLLWRKLSLALLALAPILLSALLTVACMVLLGLPFNFANVIVIPLLMGIGIDSGIHLVHRWLGTADGETLMESTTPRAIFYSAITTIASFGSLAFSSHLGMANMGTVLSIGMVLTIVSNLIVLPALLALQPRQGAVDSR